MAPSHGGGGERKGEPSVDARLVPFNTFFNNLPKTVKECNIEKLYNGLKLNKNEALLVLDRLLRCLQSQKTSSQQDAFITLVILLTQNNHIKTQCVLDAIDEIFVTDGDNTRGERRIVYAARVMSLGAIVRSKRVPSLDVKTLNHIVSQLVVFGEKRKSLLVLSAPFISETLSSLKAKQLKKLTLVPIQTLLESSSKHDVPSLFKISLTAYRLELDLKSSLMESMESICNTFIGFVKHDDQECLSQLFQYLVATKKTKEFWKLISTMIGPYHFDLLYASILAAVESGCPLKHIVRRGIVMPMVELFGNVGDHDASKKATTVFRTFLNWDPTTSKMSSKSRQSVIRLLFEEGNLSSEYKSLHAVLRRFLTFLNTEELDLLYSICQPLTRLQHRGGNSTLTLLLRFLYLRNTGLETKLSIAKELFHSGFCLTPPETSAGEEVIAPEILAIRKKISREGFACVLKSTFDMQFLKEFFSYVASVVKQNVDGISLENPPSPEDLTDLKRIRKLLKKVEDEELKSCLRVYWMFIATASSQATKELDVLVKVCEQTRTLQRSERTEKMIEFILCAIREDRVIFDYESLFGRLLKEKALSSDSVQLLINIIDLDNGQIEAEDESSDEETPLMENEQNLDNGKAFDKTPEEDGNSDENSEDEESMDLDDASETELNRMDVALANVFSTKMKMKEERRLEETLTMRALNLVSASLHRHKSTDEGTILLMLVTPCLSLLVKSAKNKNSGIHARIVDVVKRLSRVKKVKDTDFFEVALIQNVCDDIEGILKKKLPKHIRNLVRGTLSMLNRCFKKESETREDELSRNAMKRILKTSKTNPTKKVRTE